MGVEGTFWGLHTPLSPLAPIGSLCALLLEDGSALPKALGLVF